MDVKYDLDEKIRFFASLRMSAISIVFRIDQGSVEIRT
jgi:hypothetical protein